MTRGAASAGPCLAPADVGSLSRARARVTADAAQSKASAAALQRELQEEQRCRENRLKRGQKLVIRPVVALPVPKVLFDVHPYPSPFLCVPSWQRPLRSPLSAHSLCSCSSCPRLAFSSQVEPGGNLVQRLVARAQRRRHAQQVRTRLRPTDDIGQAHSICGPRNAHLVRKSSRYHTTPAVQQRTWGSAFCILRPKIIQQCHELNPPLSGLFSQWPVPV